MTGERALVGGVATVARLAEEEGGGGGFFILEY